MCPEDQKLESFGKQNLKNTFSKIGHNMSMGRSPTEIVFVLEFFYRKFVKKNFAVGDPKIDDFGPFFKTRCPKFLPIRKKRIF